MSFPKKTPIEKKLLTFDFVGEAAEGTTLSNPTITVTVKSGAGVYSDLQVDTPVVVDAPSGAVGQAVQVFAWAGLSGTTYRINCQADASNGEHHEIDKDLPVAANAAVVD